MTQLTPQSGEVVFRLDATLGKASDPPVTDLVVSIARSTVVDSNLQACLLAALRRSAPSLPSHKNKKSKARRHRFELAFEVRAAQPVEPWLGFGRHFVPDQVLPAADPAAENDARRHLEKAIALYETIALDAPDDPVAALGLGWCEAQRGGRPAALKAYRRAFELAWEKEQKLLNRGLGQVLVAEEAARALITLLDPKADEAEIDRLSGAARQMGGLIRPVTPIVVPTVDGVGLADVVDPDAEVRFDLDGTGRARAWGWTRGAGAWLVYDHDGQGRIDSAVQMFGAVSFLAFWPTGYDALAALDDDGDGALRGAELVHLALWKDADGDGRSDVGEVRPLTAWGITGLATAFERDGDGQPFAPRGVELVGGGTRPSWDWTSKGRPVALEGPPGAEGTSVASSGR